MAQTLEMLCRGKGVYWDFNAFILPEIHSDIVILFTKGLSLSPQVDMLFQPFFGNNAFIKKIKWGEKVETITPF